MKTMTNLSRGSRFSQYHNAEGNLCRQGLSCRMEELASLRSERETRVTATISDVQHPQHKTKKTGGRSVGYSLLLGHSRPAVRSTASRGRSPKRHTVGLPFGRMTIPIVPSGLPVSSWALV
jgi:hypothetical protein